MDGSDFSRLIGRLEREADERPRFYLAKVAALAALGYLGLALLAAAILATCVAIISTAIDGERPSTWLVLCGVAAAVILIATVRALWVRFGEPDDLEITREQAPGLFALIDELSTKMGAPPLASVTVNGDFNACIRQIPRWGVFGSYRNHLQLGVPLLMALSVEEFASVLAHELGHLGGPSAQFKSWIYRQRLAWNLLGQKLAQPANAFERILGRFYGWYVPWFYTYSLVLARSHECAADQAAAALTSDQTLARALTKLELMGRFLSEVFWTRFLAQVERSPEPPQRPYSLLPRAFRIAQKEWARQDWLNQALSRYASPEDTHPSLAERLAAIDVQPALPPFSTEPSALTLVGGLARHLIDHCDDLWRAQNLANWRKRHDEIKEARWKIAEYEQYDAGDLKPEDLWAKAHLLFTVNREAEGIETLQLLAAREGRYPQAHLLLGRLLLERGSERGLQHLYAAAEQDAEVATTAGSIGYTYLVNRGRKGEAMRFWQRVSAFGAG